MDSCVYFALFLRSNATTTKIMITRNTITAIRMYSTGTTIVGDMPKMFVSTTPYEYSEGVDSAIVGVVREEDSNSIPEALS